MVAGVVNVALVTPVKGKAATPGMPVGAVSAYGTAGVAALLIPAKSATGTTAATMTRIATVGRSRVRRLVLMIFLSYDVVTAVEWDLGHGLQTLIRFLMHSSPGRRSN